MIVKHNSRYFTVHDNRVQEWPMSKALKMSQRYNSPILQSSDHVLTWDDVEECISRIALAHPNVDSVTCPPGRGGLVPAAMLAYKLDIPFRRLGDHTANAICIDDIIDTGSTLKDCIGRHPNITYAGMVSRWHNFNLTVGRVLLTPEFVVFPWDPAPSTSSHSSVNR